MPSSLIALLDCEPAAGPNGNVWMGPIRPLTTTVLRTISAGAARSYQGASEAKRKSEIKVSPVVEGARTMSTASLT